jgi:hypothetical protein
MGSSPCEAIGGAFSNLRPSLHWPVAATLEHLAANQPPLVLLVGDFSYADVHLANDTSVVDMSPPYTGEPPAVAQGPLGCLGFLKFAFLSLFCY